MSIRIEGGLISEDALSAAAKTAREEVLTTRLESRYPLRYAVADVAAVAAEMFLENGPTEEVDELMDGLKATIKYVEEVAVDDEKDEVFSGVMTAVVVGMRAAMRERFKEVGFSDFRIKGE